MTRPQIIRAGMSESLPRIIELGFKVSKLRDNLYKSRPAHPAHPPLPPQEIPEIHIHMYEKVVVSSRPEIPEIPGTLGTLEYQSTRNTYQEYLNKLK